MARKISKTRRVANISNPTGPGGKFHLSDDSDAVIFGNSNNTSIKFGKLNVGRFQIAHNSNNTDDFYRTSRGILQGLQNQPDSDYTIDFLLLITLLLVKVLYRQQKSRSFIGQVFVMLF